MPQTVQELRFHLMEHVGGPPPCRAGCRHISRLLSLHLFPCCPHSFPSKSNPFPPSPTSSFVPHCWKERGRGVVSQLPPHWSSPPSPPSPPTLPPPPSLLGGARVEKPSSPLTHPNSASETVFKSERVLSVTSHV